MLRSYLICFTFSVYVALSSCTIFTQRQNLKIASDGEHLDAHRKECREHNLCICWSNRGVTFSFISPQTGPCSGLALSLTLTEEVLAAVVSGRVEKSRRGHFGLQMTAGMRSCVCLCLCAPELLSVYSKCVLINMCLPAALCFAADSHLSILAGT